MDDFVAVRCAYMLLSIFILIACVAFSKWREYSRSRELKALVSWCVATKKYGELCVNAHDLPLWSYISNTQTKLHLAQPYRISGEDEWGYVKEILKEYQRDLIQSYFKGHLTMIKSKYEIYGEDYFMITLCDFLQENQAEYKFLNHDMHQERLSYKEYGKWGGTLFDATYSLTDFAIIYHKLYYIAFLYCKNSKITNPDALPNWHDQREKSLKEILDTNKIELSRF